MASVSGLTRPSVGRRLLAIVSLVATAVLLVFVVVVLARNLIMLAIGLVGVALAVAGAWWMLTERMPRRGIGIAGLIVGAIVIVFALVEVASRAKAPLLDIVLALLTLAIASAAGRAAVAPMVREFDALRSGKRISPKKPVLLCNPWSGGGKVKKFGLADMAKDMGVEVIFLDHGLDLAKLARDAIANGADCLGMAGGDGSQALVASIAHEHDIPFVCISAGTRNHFAQDLGFDKEDPRKGMAAFGDGYERFIDFGTVGDRLFVNNVSLGVYADIVQQDSYRNAKLDTTKQLLPKLLGEQAEPFDLQFTTPDGEKVDSSFVIMVSNNPYVWSAASDFAQRRTMDSGKLGVFAINARSGGEAAEIATRAMVGLAKRDQYFHEFTCENFTVTSHAGTAFAGIDGEALQLDTPLEFKSHPRALRMLVPKDVIAAEATRRARAVTPKILLEVAAGRVPSVLEHAAQSA